MSVHPHFIIAASLGIGMQPTAIAVLEQKVLKDPRWNAKTGALRLRHLDRLSLDANYPDTVAQISTLLGAPEIKDGERCGRTDVLLDLTGSGRAIVELFERAEIDPIEVRIVGAGRTEEKVPGGQWHIPKVEMVGVLRVIYEDGRLQMAKDLPLVPTLKGELRDFNMQQTRPNPNDPESWRERPDDDLVFAVALAAWRASRDVPYPQDDDPGEKQRPLTGPGAWMGM